MRHEQYGVLHQTTASGSLSCCRVVSSGGASVRRTVAAVCWIGTLHARAAPAADNGGSRQLEHESALIQQCCSECVSSDSAEGTEESQKNIHRGFGGMASFRIRTEPAAAAGRVVSASFVLLAGFVRCWHRCALFDMVCCWPHTHRSVNPVATCTQQPFCNASGRPRSHSWWNHQAPSRRPRGVRGESSRWTGGCVSNSAICERWK